MQNKIRGKATDGKQLSRDSPGATDEDNKSVTIDSPCWGSPTRCSLADLLNVFGHDRSIILLETVDYLVLNKPPDLRMDGDYPATVHKLLTYWYPPKSIQQLCSNHNDLDHDDHDPINHDRMMEIISKLAKSNDLKDAEIRPCHQLDYATSGVLFAGRNRKAAGRACEAFRNRTNIQNVYLALVHSHVQILETSSSSPLSSSRCCSVQVLSLMLSDLYQQI